MSRLIKPSSMRKPLTLLLFVAFAISASAQTTLFSENFDGSTIGFNATSSGTSATWSITNTLSVSGSFSDSAVVGLSDSLYLESTAFSTIGYSFIAFNFSHIAKISFFDRAIVEYSTDSGATWSLLTSSEYNGTGFLNQNAFSAVSYTAWDIANATSTPTSSWWRAENYDLSSAAGFNNVKVRFTLIDADNNGAVNHYGWLLDNVEVIGSPCEIIPPSIQFTGNVLIDSVYNTGPFIIEADIQDASGINSASLIYTLNSGNPDTISMSNSMGNTYQATIPAANIGDTICYYVIAFDGTTCLNKAQFPQACNQFILTTSPPPTCIGTPVSTFNYEETFASFTPGNGFSTVGSFANNWENDASNSYDWWVFNFSTGSSSTGPSADHSQGDANYLYVEASQSFTNREAILNTPCYDLSNVFSPSFSFWYHMYGNNMGDLHVDIFFGGIWVLDIMPAISGNQGNQWLKQTIDLSAYQGNIVKLRFRANVGPGFRSDFALDDIEITAAPANDLELTSIVSPSDVTCNGVSNEFVTVNISNFGRFNIDTIPLAYQVNNGSIITDTAFLNLTPNGSANHTFQQPFNMSSPGNYLINSWVNLSADGNTSNDSLLNYSVSTSQITSNFPDTTTFDNFISGVPGTFLDGWRNGSDDQHDWYVYTGATPTGQTGPSTDTTTGTGNYVYMEATGVSTGAEANLTSKCFDISNLNRPELNFFYHMYGNTMGDLHIDISINGILIQDIVPSISGNQGNKWNQASVNLTPYKGIVKLVFRASRGNDIRSDIAIDDVSIRDAQPVGIESKEPSKQTVLIFPNPVNDRLVVDLGVASPTQIQVLDATGKLMLEKQFIERSKKIDCSQLPAGIYFIRVQTAEKLTTKKFIKN